MQKKFKWIAPVPFFTLCSSVSVLIPRLLIRNLAALFRHIGPIANMDQHTISQATEILSQLQHAHIRLPWLPILVCGTIIGILCTWLLRRCRHRIAVFSLAWIVLFILLTPAAFWLTEVNGIRTGALLSALLPILPALL